MKTIEITQKLEDVIVAGYQNKGKIRYLGMSQIHRKEEDIINEYLYGSSDKERFQLLIYGMATAFESIILDKLAVAGLVIPQSSQFFQADFDDRFRGRTIAEFVDGSLCEIKSTIEEKLLRIEKEKHLPNAHFVQAQMYMYWGGYEQTKIVYVARDTGRVVVRNLKYDKKIALTYNEKAKRILQTIDNYK